MKKTILLVLALALVAGCEQGREARQEWKERDRSRWGEEDAVQSFNRRAEMRRQRRQGAQQDQVWGRADRQTQQDGQMRGRQQQQQGAQRQQHWGGQDHGWNEQDQNQQDQDLRRRQQQDQSQSR